MKSSTSPLKSICIVLLISTFFSQIGYGQEMLNFSDATLFVPRKESKELAKVIQVLHEEIAKRSGIVINSAKKIDADGQQIILIMDEGLEKLPDSYVPAINNLENIDQEGYHILMLPTEQKVIIHAKTKQQLKSRGFQLLLHHSSQA